MVSLVTAVKKGVLFMDFPPVLQLQLKRFEFDSERYTTKKINDRYEFPLQLDLDRYLSPDANRSIQNLYTLYRVLVHSGSANGGGHYAAYIRPNLSDMWYKFDDERVSIVDVETALEEQYGGEEELPQTSPFKPDRYSNAYMLAYIRETDKDKMMCNMVEEGIADHFWKQIQVQEDEDIKKKSFYYTFIKVARDEDIKEQAGSMRHFELVNYEKVKSFQIPSQTYFNVFKEMVAREFSVPIQFQRFWFASCQYNRYRPNRPLTVEEESLYVGQLRNAFDEIHSGGLKLFLEVELGLDSQPIALPEKTADDILLFFKLYDPEKEELRYIGRLFVKGNDSPGQIFTTLNQM